MKVSGIVCEYNPFHYGHEYHITKTRELTQCDVLVCVMSGNFVQRGEPAIVDKFARAKVAIENGCDIVIELPFAYATQSAAYFAKGAIETLKLVKIDTLCFGSESNDLDYLTEMANLNINIKKTFIDGNSYVKAHELALGRFDANDILGINYLKALKNTNIKPLCIQRTNQYHNKELETNISSATAIRHALHDKIDISKATRMEIDEPVFLEYAYPTIQLLLTTLPSKYLSALFLMDEGIENHLIKQANAPTFEAFMQGCITRRYTRSKIQRTLIHLLNQTSKETMNTLPTLDHVRILAFNQKGKEYLNSLKKEVKIVSRFNQLPKAYQEMEMKAACVYASFYPLKKRNELIQSVLKAPLCL